MKTCLPHLKKSLPPLLLALAVNQAHAIEVIVVGDAGAAGLAGTAPGMHGAAAAAAAELWREVVLAPQLELIVYGGHGGRGGDGGARNATTVAGDGGNGGQGAATGGTAIVVADSGAAWSQSTVFGGAGGDAGSAGGVGADDEWNNWPAYDPAFGRGGAADRKSVV